MTNFIQKTHLDIGFSDFNCLLDSQCSLLTSQILGRCIKLKWSNRAYAVYWLCGTLLCPWQIVVLCAQPRHSMNRNGKLVRTQMVPTRCQDFLRPYLQQRDDHYFRIFKYSLPAQPSTLLTVSIAKRPNNCCAQAISHLRAYVSHPNSIGEKL